MKGASVKRNDTVRIKQTWHSDFYDRYIGCELQGEKGKIVDTIWENREAVGYRVRFPKITIWDDENQEIPIQNFEWPFRKEYIEPVDGEVKFKKRRYRTGKYLEKKLTEAYKLKAKGLSVSEIASQLFIPEGTIRRWVYLKKK